MDQRIQIDFTNGKKINIDIIIFSWNSIVKIKSTRLYTVKNCSIVIVFKIAASHYINSLDKRLLCIIYHIRIYIS